MAHLSAEYWAQGTGLARAPTWAAITPSEFITWARTYTDAITGLLRNSA